MSQENQGGESEIKSRYYYHINNQLVSVCFMTHQNELINFLYSTHYYLNKVMNSCGILEENQGKFVPLLHISL